MSSQPENLMSAELIDKDQAAVLAQLAAVKKTLSFLITLTPQERQRVAKPSADVLHGCESVAAMVNDNSKLFPKEVVDGAELSKDLRLLKALTPIAESVNGLAAALEDTLVALKSDVSRNGMKGYAMAKILARTVPGIESSIAALAEFFDRPARSKKA